MPRKHSKVGPYKLLMTILYGQHKWIEREGGRTRIPVPKLASHLNTRAYRLNEYLEDLEAWGLLDYVRWSPYFITVQPRPPVGFELALGEAIDITGGSDV